MPAPRTTTFCERNGLDLLRAPARAADGLQVEEERLDHVLRDLPDDEVGEVPALDLRGDVEVDLRALHGRGHDVVRGRVVGALDLLAQVGREGRAASARASGCSGCRRGSCSPSTSHGCWHSGFASIHALAAGISSSCVGTISSTMPISSAFFGLSRLPSISSCMSASAMPSMRTVRVTPPPPGSRPSCTSGKPTTALGSSTITRWWRGQRDLQPAAERRAVDRGHDRLAERLQAPQLGLDLPHAGSRSSRRPRARPCAGR